MDEGMGMRRTTWWACFAVIEQCIRISLFRIRLSDTIGRSDYANPFSTEWIVGFFFLEYFWSTIPDGSAVYLLLYFCGYVEINLNEGRSKQGKEKWCAWLLKSFLPIFLIEELPKFKKKKKKNAEFLLQFFFFFSHFGLPFTLFTSLQSLIVDVWLILLRNTFSWADNTNLSIVNLLLVSFFPFFFFFSFADVKGIFVCKSKEGEKKIKNVVNSKNKIL